MVGHITFRMHWDTFCGAQFGDVSHVSRKGFCFRIDSHRDPKNLCSSKLCDLLRCLVVAPLRIKVVSVLLDFSLGGSVVPRLHGNEQTARTAFRREIKERKILWHPLDHKALFPQQLTGTDFTERCKFILLFFSRHALSCLSG